MRFAHCRENPYQMLTDGAPETEPERGIRHEVRRQLDLVATIGGVAANERVASACRTTRRRADALLTEAGIVECLYQPPLLCVFLCRIRNYGTRWRVVIEAHRRTQFPESAVYPHRPHRTRIGEILFDMRLDGDYEDFVAFDDEKIRPLIDEVRRFVARVEEVLQSD